MQSYIVRIVKLLLPKPIETQKEDQSLSLKPNTNQYQKD